MRLYQEKLAKLLIVKKLLKTSELVVGSGEQDLTSPKWDKGIPKECFLLHPKLFCDTKICQTQKSNYEIHIN